MNEFVNRITVKTIPEQIAEQIKNEIYQGKLKPGEKLPPLEQLSEKLGVSKPTVREALQSLSRLGFVVSTKGRNGGYFITESGREKFMETMYEMIILSLAFNTMERKHLLEIRKMIEIPCVGLAAERRTPENLLKLQEFIGAENKCGDDIQEVLELDLQFHLAISECTQNPLAKTLINAISRSYIESELDWDRQTKWKVNSNMDSIIEAISKQDSAMAISEMEKHLNYFI